LKIAEAHQIASVAFPAISTGAFGYPLDEGAEVACMTVARSAPDLRHVRLVRFVLFNQAAHGVFCTKLVRATGQLADRGGADAPREPSE
jgi:O-acetyl-ADP-ribose deacetylase (regulator of RNase III)